MADQPILIRSETTAEEVRRGEPTRPILRRELRQDRHLYIGACAFAGTALGLSFSGVGALGAAVVGLLSGIVAGGSAVPFGKTAAGDVSEEHLKQPRSGSVGSAKMDLAKLPRAGQYLFGRENELAELDDAWEDEQTNIISLVAWGGVGKSALVKRWLDHMRSEEFRGAGLVYGWSFYKQSMREEEASADEFFADALRWFGEPEPERLQQTERARRLAELIQKERTLLVLDGLEPLQHSPKTGLEGQIRDQTLAELVRLLAWHNPGLLVITSRYVVDDVRDQRATTAPVIELGHLSPQAGAKLLHALGVQGDQEELEDASREFGGHSLALNLLGTYLRDILGGDVRRRGEVSLLEEYAERGGHARRIMRSYEEQFASSPELAVLHLMGLFDRPAKRVLIDVLRRPPVIEGLNNQLVDQNERDWKRTLARLKHAKLLSEETADEIDAHPLVREHFGERLRNERPEAFRAGHGRLYQHLRDGVEKYPKTFDQMAPLFQAMYHGCQAGRQEEALDEVYYERIRRRKDYSTRALGAFGADLAALAGLFEEGWTTPAPTISRWKHGYLLNEAARDLRGLGRLREVAETMQQLLKLPARSYEDADARASNLSELLLLLGDVVGAVSFGKESLGYADRSADQWQRVVARAIYADALHKSGDVAQAVAFLAEAEALQARHPDAFPRLCRFEGHVYCDALLTQGRAAEVHERASRTLAWGRQWGQRSGTYSFEIALDQISLGRAALALGEHDGARAQLDQAVQNLREAGTIDHLPRGLLARAALFRETGELGLARQDLDEAMRIANRSEMRLFQCDADLEYARLALAEGKREKAREYVAEAKRLVEETGYGHRRPEVEELIAATA